MLNFAAPLRMIPAKSSQRGTFCHIRLSHCRASLQSWIANLLIICSLVATANVSAESNLEPQELVQQVSEQILAQLTDTNSPLRSNPARLRALVDGLLGQHLDFERIARMVLGRYWKQASPEQRQRFILEFRALLVRTYSTALAEYGGQRIHVLPQRRSASDDDVLVRAEVRHTTAPPIPIHFALHKKDNSWKVYDVLIDGISLVTNYRASIAAEIRVTGIEGLIDSLASRNGTMAEAKNQP